MLDESTNKRRRTSEDFLAFCRIILDYENYEGRSSGGVARKRIHSSKQQKNSVEVGNEVEDETEDSKSSASSSDGGGRDKDGFNEVTCYCNKPFAGRPMIECSSCLTWIHLSCAKIKRTHIPDTWNCSKCLDKLASSSSSSSSSSSNTSSSTNAKRSSRKRKTSPSTNSAINLTL